MFGATTNRNEAAYAFTDSQLFVVKREWRRAAPDHHGQAQLVAAPLHARRPHAAGCSRDAGAKRLQRRAHRRVALARRSASTQVVTRRARSLGEQFCRIAGFAHVCTSRPKTAATKSCTPCAWAAARCRHCSVPRQGSFTNLAIPDARRQDPAVRQLGERERARRDRADHAAERQGAGAHQVQRAARCAARPAAHRKLLVHLQPRQAHPQLPRAAAGLRRGEEISAVRRDPRRPARHVARPVLRALELSPAGRARLRAAAHQLLRLDRLRRGVRALHPGRSAQGSRPTRSTRRPTPPSAHFASSTAAGNAPAAPATAGTWRTGCRARPRATNA